MLAVSERLQMRHVQFINGVGEKNQTQQSFCQLKALAAILPSSQGSAG